MAGRSRTTSGEGGGVGRTALPPTRDLTRMKPGWYVVCSVFASGPCKSEHQAQIRLADIERVGACSYPHAIIRHEGLACMCNHGQSCGPGGELP